MEKDRLPPCPSTSNCVCSYDTNSKSYIAPFPMTEQGIEKLKTIIEQEPRTKVIESSSEYLHAEFHSGWFKFIDDVEFQLDKRKKVIHVRSASRTGYWDMGVNRNRIERLRELYLK